MDSEEHTHNLKLPLLVPNQSGKEFTHNEALIIIDNLMHNTVIDILSTPPAELNVGDKYIVDSNATEAFKNKGNKIAIYDENGWRFIEVQKGYFVWVINRGDLYVFEENNWLVLCTNDKRIKITEPKINEILKYNGSNFINSNSLSDIEQLSIINDLTVKDNNKLNKFKLEVVGDNSNIIVSNDGENWLNSISVNNINGQVNFGSDITIKGIPVTGNNLIEIRENYQITESSILEFTGLEPDFQHKFVITDLVGDTNSNSYMFCNIGYDNTYIETNYCFESVITNSNENYSYIKNKNKTNSYQITSDKYTDNIIKNTNSTNIEFYIDPITNSEKKFMSCTVKIAAEYSSLKYYKTVSSCLVYNDNKINKIKFFLSKGNFAGGNIKHYVIK